MAWKRKKVNTKIEENIITGLIVSDQFIREVRPILRIDFLQIPYARTVARWCIEYFDKYEKAPNTTIQDLYSGNADNLDEDQSELISDFLANISDEYEKEEGFNTQYMLDQSELYLKKRKLELLNNDISGAIEVGDIEKAEAHVGSFTRITRHSGSGIDLLTDNNALEEAMNFEDEVLFRFPGDLGDLIGDYCRGDLIAVAAPPKRGKTWWMEEIALRALWAKLKVLFISLEMLPRQLIRRMYQNLLSELAREGDPREVEIPYFTRNNEIDYIYKKKKGLNLFKVKRKAQALQIMIKTGRLKIKCYPAYSANVGDIKTLLDNYEYYEDFIPDVMVVDYADILAPEIGASRDYRHIIDGTWKGLRGVAQTRNNLVVTGSQTNKSTFSKDTEQDDIAEDSRKLAHVSSMMALNQSIEDKRKGVMRIRMLAERFSQFQVDTEVVVLQQLALGKPFLDSRWKKLVEGL